MGHWFEYNRATKSAVQATGDVSVHMLGNITIQPDVAAELGAEPHFRYTVWDQIYNHPQRLRRYWGIGLHNFRVYRDLVRHLKKSEFYDTVFAPTVVLHHFFGYHHVAKKFAGRHFRQMVLLVRNNIAAYDENGKRTFRSTAKFWKKAITRFQPFLDNGLVRFVTDSERLADEYEELTGIRFEVLPHPSLIGLDPSETQVTENNQSESVRIFLPGPARYEKGSDKLLRVAQSLASKKIEAIPQIDFVGQWAKPFSLPDGTVLSPDDQVLSDNRKVKLHFHRESLSSEDYRLEIQKADIILLPYRRETYFARISGVAVEAMLLAKPIVFTSDTWVDTIAQRFEIGVSCGESCEELEAALLGAIQSLDLHKKEATTKRQAVAEYFSSENFSSILLTDTSI